MTRTLFVLVLAFSVSVTAAASVASDHVASSGQYPKAQARFAQADSNHDGKLSQDEWQHMREQGLAAQFRRMDLDHDGSLTAQEIGQAHRQRQLMRAAHRHQRMAMREKLRALDLDHDHALSRAEIGERMPWLARNFDRIDQNHDGKVTRDEMRAARAALRTAPR